MYHILYDVEAHPEGLSIDEIKASGKGGCTALLLGSILFPPDGSYSIMFNNIDGRTGERLDSHEEWKAWIMMANYLMKKDDLSPDQQLLAETVWDIFANGVRHRRVDHE